MLVGHSQELGHGKRRLREEREEHVEPKLYVDGC